MFSSLVRPFVTGLTVAAAVASVNTCAWAQTTKNPVQTAGKYSVELRIPAGGIVAGEEMDIEFRVTDTANVDPVLGARGVPRATVKASVSMPAMPAMPNAVPKIHSEGVPGDYGLVTTFPHGGTYRIQLTITPPGERTPFTVAFPVAVKDEDTSGSRKPAPKPFTLEMKTQPGRVHSGGETKLTLSVKERATGKIVQKFDEVHTEPMHLIIVRSDLGAFFHEHPTLNPDGTFTHAFTFPTGGRWNLFADCAPAGAGGQVLMATVNVGGASPAPQPLKPETAPIVEQGGLTLALTIEKLPAKTMIPLTFTLSGPNGKPISDLQPWLGAMAHLILIEKDAKTFVHSHPDESDPTNGKRGSLTFLARFPKPGVYRGWVQFQRDGKITTMPFTVAATAPTGEAE
jgi:hypothetical protein